MASKHWVRLPDDLVKEVEDWAKRNVIKNRYTSHDIERNPRLRQAAKLSEYAFAQWAGVPRESIDKISGYEFDVAIGDKRVEVRSCDLAKSLLCWPAKKIGEYDRRKFTHLALVKFDLPNFFVRGWVTKDRFRLERLVATKNSLPPLDIDTWYMHENNLDSMDDFFECQVGLFEVPAKRERFLHYCHCGKWGSFGYDVSAFRGNEGKWYCFEHRP